MVAQYYVYVYRQGAAEVRKQVSSSSLVTPELKKSISGLNLSGSVDKVCHLVTSQCSLPLLSNT